MAAVAAVPRGEALASVHEMSTERLRREYVSLKSTSYSLTVEESHLMSKIDKLREESVRAELNAEMKEEQVSNQLFRRLDGAEKEVQRYQGMLKEEEHETETLSKRIKEMRSQQTEVENTLEERQEYLLMNLQRKLLEMARKKTAVEQELMTERQKYLDVLVTRLNMLRGRSGGVSSAESSVVLHPQPVVAEAAAPPLERHVDVMLPPPTTATATSPRVLPSTADTLSVPSAEKSLQDDVCSGATSHLPLATSSPLAMPAAAVGPGKRPVDAAGASTPRGMPKAMSGRLSCSTTPRSTELTPRSSHSSETHYAVVELEQKLNQLLVEQASAMQRTSATEKQCMELTAKLRAVQEATFLDRARATKMKEELKEARARLSEVESGAVPTTSFDDSSFMSGRNLSFDHAGSFTMTNLSLRERTRELLSSVPPPNPN